MLLIYDISNAQSFRNVAKWLAFARQYGRKALEVTLVGNKTDLDEWRQVSTEQALKASISLWQCTP